MFIIPPNNFNQSSMCNTVPIFSDYPMMPMPDFDTFNETRQGPMPMPQPMPTPAADQGFDVTAESPASPVVNNVLYNQGWLTTQIGKYVKIEFLIGSNLFIDREGMLTEVGISYVVIRETGTNDIVMCDIYSIKFVRVYDNQTPPTR
jgi:hypothetical protein